MGTVQVLHPPLLTADLIELCARGIVSMTRENWLVAHGSFREKSTQLKVLGRTIPRPLPIVLPGFKRSSLEIEGQPFSDLIGGHPKDVIVDDALLIQVSYDELNDRMNPYETDHYCLSAVFLPSWGMSIAYFGRKSWETWNVVHRRQHERLPHVGRRRGLP